ncbi:DUF3237 family protein [Paenibacillus sp. PR3]|uniref:DUF3237 family protein n=1 Tax=Paenibacillus terricola TaxID=2763503 RepID=A0ABR8MXX7_9BACL|nr:DUF3237 family protein [Paenibacillus terricola]MBD3919911.1 DUF3237 family protein [Paenibacillus terricola]
MELEKLEKVLTIHVRIERTIELHQDDGDSVVMISFTGNATGEFFQGEILEGGIDTQVIGRSGGRHTLSARYMLQGKDYEGQACRIYIENNGDANKQWNDALFRTRPSIITNSKALSSWNNDLFLGEGFPTESGVDITIYRWVQ